MGATSFFDQPRYGDPAAANPFGEIDWKSLIGKGAPLALSLFAPSDRSGDITPDVNSVRDSSKKLMQTGQNLIADSTQALNPVLHYFAALASGDPSAVASATAPERARILDTYDSARRAISTFSPRGGGVTSSIAANRTSEARDLAVLPQSARGQGAQTLASIGQTLTQAGTSAQEVATQQLAQVLYPMLAQSQQHNQNTAQTFEALGSFLALAFL